MYVWSSQLDIQRYLSDFCGKRINGMREIVRQNRVFQYSFFFWSSQSDSIMRFVEIYLGRILEFLLQHGVEWFLTYLFRQMGTEMYLFLSDAEQKLFHRVASRHWVLVWWKYTRNFFAAICFVYCLIDFSGKRLESLLDFLCLKRSFG